MINESVWWRSLFIGGPHDGGYGATLCDVQDSSYWPQTVYVPAAFASRHFACRYERIGMHGPVTVAYRFVGYATREEVNGGMELHPRKP